MKKSDLKISIYSDNIAITSTVEKIAKKFDLKVAEEDPDIAVVDIESPVSENLKLDNTPIIYAGTLDNLKKILKRGRTENFEYVILPADENEFEIAIQKMVNILKIKSEVNRAVKESIEYYNTLLETKKTLRLMEITDPDIKTEEILDFLELELGENPVEIWLYDFDEKTLNLTGFRGYPVKHQKLQIKKDQIPQRPVPARFENEIILPLSFKGKIFGLIRFKKNLKEWQLKKLNLYGENISIALFNSLKYFYKKREQATYSKRGILNKEVLHEFISRNLSQAQRYSTPLSFLIFKLENADALSEIFGDVAEKRWNRVVNTITSTLRASDIIGEMGENTYLIILTNTDYMGAIFFLRRFKNILKTHSVFTHGEKTGEFVVRYNIASYPVSGYRWSEIEEVLIRGIDPAFTPFFRYNITNLRFFESVEMLRNSIMRDKSRNGLTLAPRYFESDPATLEEMLSAFFREMCIPGNRGIGYINLPWMEEEHLNEIVEKYLDAGNDRNFPVYFFTSHLSPVRKRGYSGKFLISAVDENLGKTGFVLFLTRWGSYLYFFWKDDNELKGFHCSDTLLVEELMEKLQRQFYLKPAV